MNCNNNFFNYSYGTIDFNIHFTFNKNCNWFNIKEIENILSSGLKYKLTKRQNKLFYIKKQYEIENNIDEFECFVIDEIDFIVKYPITYIYKCIKGKKIAKCNKNYINIIEFISNNYDFVLNEVKKLLEKKFSFMLQHYESSVDLKIIGFHPYRSLIDKNIERKLKNYDEENNNRIIKKIIKNNYVLDFAFNC
jgi:hypothetical protein